MLEPQLVKAYAELFRGRTDARGTLEGGCVRENITLEHYRKHLAGERSLGIYPLLDDGTCHFAAIDIDVKDFKLVLSIRQELANIFIPAYITASRKKGFHIYMFADESNGQPPFIAKEIRHILNTILNRLGIKAEVFPKQDAVSEQIPLGNYINLPCFGIARPFLSADMKEIKTEDAIPKIKLTPHETIERALRSMPPGITVIANKAQPVKEKKPRSKGAPPCIEAILKGVSAGARDEAAFALARHYFDNNYLAEEVLGLLSVWDKRNSPPINDIKLLETKVHSAQKGYAFGCNSIINNPNLAAVCVGQRNCKYFQKSEQERIKKGQLRPTTFYEDDRFVYEEVIPPHDRAQFACYNKESGEITFSNVIECGDFSVVPYIGEEVSLGAVILPEGVEEYNSIDDLIAELKAHIHDYCDLPPRIIEFAAWYVIMSWIYDRLPTVPFLRFKGDTGTGKSRCLDCIGILCYKPMMMAGAVTPAPIYRIIRRFRGTLVLDEADFNDTTEKSDVITILNCGFERNDPVIRCDKNNPDDLQILPCFGPKLIATRGEFEDKALESRCITHVTEETDRQDIPPLLTDAFFKRSSILRKKLLRYRFDFYTKIDAAKVEDIDLGQIEPRLKQMGLGFAYSFRDFPEVLDSFKEFLKQYNQDLIQQRAESYDGQIALAFLKLSLINGKGQVSPSHIKNLLADQKIDISVARVSSRMRSFGLDKVSRRWVADLESENRGKYLSFYDWKPAVVRKLIRRYAPVKEDFADLLSDETKEIDI